MTKIRIVEQVGSTNGDLLADHQSVEGDWLVALRQDQGRGRQGRLWAGLEGNFFGSTLIQLRTDDPPPASLALVAGLALIEATQDVSPHVGLQLKWPNDLMLGDAKLAGILLERSEQRVVAGFGVNLAAAPEVEGRLTASLDGIITPQGFAPILAAKFDRLLDAWRLAEPSSLTKAWEEKAHPLATRLSVHASSEERVSGTFDGLEPDGALRLRRDDGSVDVIRTGDVFFR